MKIYNSFSVTLSVLFLIALISCSGGSSGGGNEAPSIKPPSESGSIVNAEGFFELCPDLNSDNQNVEPNTHLYIQFTSDMNTETINSDTVKIIDSNGTIVSGIINYDPDTQKMTFISDTPYDYEHQYSFIITNGLQDTDGNHLDNSVTYSFTIKSDNDAPQIITISPENDNANIPVNTAITAVFNEEIDPQSISNDNFTVKYSSNNSVIEGELEFSNENKTISFSPSANFNYDSNIEVSISGAKDLKENTAEDVNWTFSTASAPDNQAPVLVEQTPIINASGVSLQTKINLIFNESIDVSSVNSNCIKINNSNFEGTISYKNENKEIEFTLNNELDYSTNYTIKINKDIKDLAGNRFVGAQWSFRTCEDTFAPRALEIYPSNQGVNVPANTSITIRFDEEINSNTINESSIQLLSGNEASIAVEGTVSYNNKTLTFTPSLPLDSNELYNTYTVIVNQVEDLHGNTYEGTNWEFTSADYFDESRVSISATSPTSNQIGSIETPLHNNPIFIAFSEAVNSASVNNSSIKIFDGESEITSSIEMISANTVKVTPQNLEREKTYTVKVYGGVFGVKDLAGNQLESTEGYYTFNFTTLEKLKVIRHYYDKGFYNKNYSDYNTAFTDNFTDSDIQIHSWIVVEFNLPVDVNSVQEKLLVKRNDMGTSEIADSPENNYNIIGKISSDFPDENIRNEYIGEFEVDPSDRTKVIFKHHIVFYSNPNGCYDIEHPNWNGIKPNYRYDVEILDGIKDSVGGHIAEHNEETNKRSWSFTTTDLDYGLYWFKNGYHAIKYVPGRDVPLKYYNPSKPVFLHSHGWQNGTTGLSRQGNFRDYRREDFLWGGTTEGRWDIDTPAIDVTLPWKKGADTYLFPNGGGKDWNVGAVFWTQFADNQDEGGTQGSAKPRRAGTAIWSMYGPSSQSDGRAEYARNIYTGDKYEFERVCENSPNKALSTILADAFISCCSVRPAGFDPEFRFTGHSLGNQMVNAMLYILKERHSSGQIETHLLPDRFFIIDPFWIGNDFWLDGRGNDWDNSNAPESSGYWNRPESPVNNLNITGNALPGEVCTEIIKSVISYYSNNNIKGMETLPVAFYDTSGLPDGRVQAAVGFFNGDRNEAYREEAAIIYHQYDWLSAGLTHLHGWGEQHGNGRYQVFYQYGFAVPAGGFSPASSDEDIINAMNYDKSDSKKGRFAFNSGTDSSDISDDSYYWTTEIDEGKNYNFFKDTPAGRTGAWMRNPPEN